MLKYVYTVLFLFGVSGWLAVCSAQAGFNEEFSVYESCPVEDIFGQQLYFARSGDPQNIGDPERADIWMADIYNEQTLGHAINLGALVNSEADDYPVALLANATQLYVASNRNEAEYPLLYCATRNKQLWGEATPIHIDDHYSYHADVSYTLPFDGQFVLISAERDGSKGGLDIYTSQLLEDAHFGMPIPLANVNSAADESHPCLSPDGNTLYFLRTEMDETSMWMSQRLSSNGSAWSFPQLVTTIDNISPSGLLVSAHQHTVWSHHISDGLSAQHLKEAFQPAASLLLHGSLPATATLPATLTLEKVSQHAQLQFRIDQHHFQVAVPNEETYTYAILEVPGLLPNIITLQSDAIQQMPTNGQTNQIVSSSQLSMNVASELSLEKLQKNLQRVDHLLEQQQQKRVKNQLHQQALWQTITKDTAPLITKLRKQYAALIGTSPADAENGTLKHLSDEYNQYVQSAQPEANNHPVSSNTDPVADLREKYKRYAAAESTTDTKESTNRSSQIELESLAATAQVTALQQTWEKYLEKAHTAMPVKEITTSLPPQLSTFLDSRDYVQIEKTRSSERNYFANAAQYTTAVFSENLKALVVELSDIAQQYVAKEYKNQLSTAAQKEVHLSLEEQALLLIRAKLQHQIEARLMQQMTPSNSVSKPLKQIHVEQEVASIRIATPDILIPSTPDAAWILSDVYYDQHSEQWSGSSYRKLSALLRLLQMREDVSIHIEAYTSPDQSDDTYARISCRLRADKIKQFLVLRGIEDHRISSEGKSWQEWPAKDHYDQKQHYLLRISKYNG